MPKSPAANVGVIKCGVWLLQILASTEYVFYGFRITLTQKQGQFTIELLTQVNL